MNGLAIRCINLLIDDSNFLIACLLNTHNCLKNVKEIQKGMWVFINSSVQFTGVVFFFPKLWFFFQGKGHLTFWELSHAITLSIHCGGREKICQSLLGFPLVSQPIHFKADPRTAHIKWEKTGKECNTSTYK